MDMLIDTISYVKEMGGLVQYVNMTRYFRTLGIVIDSSEEPCGCIDGDGKILINRKLMSDDKEHACTLLHEHQHSMDLKNGLLDLNNLSPEHTLFIETRAMAKEYLILEDEYIDYKEERYINREEYGLGRFSRSEFYNAFREAEIEFYGEEIK